LDRRKTVVVFYRPPELARGSVDCRRFGGMRQVFVAACRQVLGEFRESSGKRQES
jgi:hypothetical protein